MLKTLREDGFKVTAFERRKQVGGLWAYTKDSSMTSALPCELPLKRDVGRTVVMLCSYESSDQQVYLWHVGLSNAGP